LTLTPHRLSQQIGLAAGLLCVFAPPATAGKALSSAEFRAGVHAALENRRLIEPIRQVVYYQPMPSGERYRRLRSRLVWGSTRLGGLLIASGLPLMKLTPNWGGGAAALGAALIFAPKVDRYLFRNPADVAKRHFRDNWLTREDGYTPTSIRNRRDLDDSVLMAQTPLAIIMSYRHFEVERTLGVRTASLADALAAAERDPVYRRKLKMSTGRIAEMLVRQNHAWGEDAEVIAPVLSNNSAGDVARLLDSDTWRTEVAPDLVPGLSAIARQAEGAAIGLMINQSPGHATATQISQGVLRINDSAGANVASYAGAHSRGRQAPRIEVQNDVGPSFMTRAARGLGWIGGNAGNRVLHDARGGVVLVEGTASHRFAEGMNDSDWPAVAIAMTGLSAPPRGVSNGLVIDLDEADGEPKAYRFREGQLQTTKLDAAGDPRAAALHHIEAYISEWNPRPSTAVDRVREGLQPATFR